MVENQNLPDVKKEVSKPNGVELPHLAEVRKLEGAAKNFQQIKRKQEIAKGDKLQKGDEEDAGNMLLQGFNSEPGTLPISEKPKENFVESSEVKNKRELNGARDVYREQLKNTYQKHIADLEDKPEEQKKAGQDYLGRCIKDLKINSGAPGEDDVKLIATSLPDVWKQTLLDPKSAENNPDIRRMRNVILDRVADSAAGFDLKEDFNNNQKAYEDALLQNFRDVTGLSLIREDLESYLTSDKPKEQKLVDDIDFSDNKGSIQEWRKTSSEDLGNNTILSTLGVSGGDAKNYLEGAGSEPGEFSTEFPADVDAAVELIKGEVGKNVQEGTEEGEAIIAGYFRDAGFPGNTGKTPWCMAFVQAMARRHLGYTGSKTLSARAGLNMGSKIDSEESGCIVITRGSGPSGCHIGICVGEGKYISGNSGNAVKIKAIPSGSQYRSLKKSTEPSLAGH